MYPGARGRAQKLIASRLPARNEASCCYTARPTMYFDSFKGA